MSQTVFLQAIALVGLLACSAFCSSAESLFFSLNPLDVRRISKKHPERGERLHRLLSDSTRLLSSILIGNTIVNTAAAALGYALAETCFPNRGQTIAIPVMTVLLLIFGEVGPKHIGLLYSEKLAGLYLPAVGLLIRVATPARLVLERITRKFEHLLRPKGRTLSLEEFETVVDISREQGIINAEELGMVKAVMRLDELRVSDAMTPRPDLKGVDIEDFPERGMDAALAAKVNFILLYRGSVDNVESLLDVRKFLLDPEHKLEPACIPPFYVPESCPLSRLLASLQKEHKRIAVVVDEYGGTAGLITRGDILEEIAGEVYEEMGKPRPVFQQAGPHRWLVDAGYSIQELNRKLRLHLDGGDMDRLSGWIAAHVGHVPMPNEVVESQGCRVTVLQTGKHHVTLAQIEKTEAPA